VSAGKEDPVEFDSSLISCSDLWGVAQVGGKCHCPDLDVGIAGITSHHTPSPSRHTQGTSQQWNTTTFTVALLIEWSGTGGRILHQHLHSEVMASHRFVLEAGASSRLGGGIQAPRDPWRIRNPKKPRETDQLGSLAGAARPLHHNAGVLKQCSGGTEISHGGEGQRCCWCCDFQCKSQTCKCGLAILWPSKLSSSGYRSQRCQKNYHRDNWLVAAKRSKRRRFLILRCRLFLASRLQPSGRVGLFTHQQGTWAGFRPSWDRLVLPSCHRHLLLLLWRAISHQHVRACPSGGRFPPQREENVRCVDSQSTATTEEHGLDDGSMWKYERNPHAAPLVSAMSRATGVAKLPCDGYWLKAS